MNGFIQVITTVATEADAQRLMGRILEERLAACVQVEAVRSSYHWQGAIENDQELRLTCKTRENLFKRLEQLLIAEHPYQTPEILAVPLVHVGAAYRQWLEKELAR